MHRGGTSLLAALLNIAGVNLGSNCSWEPPQKTVAASGNIAMSWQSMKNYSPG